MTRIAAIDIGTNSVRSIIVETDEHGGFSTLDDEREPTRLGGVTGREHEITPQAADRAVAALGRMLDLVRHFRADDVQVVATAAVRDAVNGAEFVTRVRTELGAEIDVIPAEEEGRLAYLSAARHFELGTRGAVFDLGGGSIEIVRTAGGHIELNRSAPLGATVLSEEFADGDPLPAASLELMRRHVRRTLVELLGSDPDPVTALVGSGGTTNAIAAMVVAARGARSASTHAEEMERADVVHLLARLARSSTAERERIPGLPAHRVDIITAGVLVVDEVMSALRANVLLVNGKGVREGIVIDALARGGRPPRAVDRGQAVVRLAERCRYDRPHAERVRDFALELFDQLSGQLGLAPETRELLDAAAVLHDVGYYIGYEKHHKHSYHLITHADLPGFTRREIALVAAIAHYHRGAMPKRRHEALAALGRDDVRLAEGLAALLRLADGIDRTRSQQVEHVDARIDGGRVLVRLVGTGDLATDVYGAIKKAGLLERVAKMPVEVEVAESRSAQ